MATVEISSSAEQIGETAGLVWHTLDKKGRLSLVQLVRQVKAPRDCVMQAIGWLAREEKIDIEDTGRNKFVSLL